MNPLQVIIIHGPNLNLLGIREQDIYGTVPFEVALRDLRAQFPQAEIAYFQSNIEGEIINKIHEVGFSYDAIILNAGGYAHTSVALADAVAAVDTPTVEVHISNIYAREDIRQKSLLSKHCVGVISGFGTKGYALAIQHFLM